ncbi:MAG: glycosyltransferase family 4 protein [Caulobacteraceae bacterium]
MSRRSAIGRMAVAVAEALAARGHQVEIIRAESEAELEGETHPTRLAVRAPKSLDFRAPNAGYDLAVAHVGDYYPFHAAFFELADRLPTLGVFHDFYLFNLFSGWLYASKSPPEVQEAEVEATYGRDALDVARRARAGQASLEEIAACAPMTEWAARRCVGALAHSGYYLDRLAAACAGPVAMSHLPWEARSVAALPKRDGGRVSAITLGHMNPNKCAGEVIQAICASPVLKTRLSYTLVGPIEPDERSRLEGLARDGGFEGLAILGRVDDETLTSNLEAADIICCLRRPVLEGASASAIEGMLSGRPTVVANAGFYGELPDDLVFKVGADVAPDDLTRVLERLVEDEPLRQATGVAASAWATDHFSIDRYTDALEALMQETVDALPLLGVGAAFGRELAGFGLRPQDSRIAHIAETVSPLLSA